LGDRQSTIRAVVSKVVGVWLDEDLVPQQMLKGAKEIFTVTSK